VTNKRKVGGYAMRQEICRAVNANQAAREALRRLIDDNPGPQTMAILVARAANALGENLAAIREIERIMASSE
jgi:predicted Zn-dependent protease